LLKYRSVNTIQRIARGWIGRVKFKKIIIEKKQQDELNKRHLLEEKQRAAKEREKLRQIQLQLENEAAEAEAIRKQQEVEELRIARLHEEYIERIKLAKVQHLIMNTSTVLTVEIRIQVLVKPIEIVFFFSVYVSML